MRKTGLPSNTWIDRFRDWLNVQGLRLPMGFLGNKSRPETSLGV